MDHLQTFSAQLRRRQIFLLLTSNGLVITGWWCGSQLLSWDDTGLLWFIVGWAIIISVLLALLSTRYLVQPLRLVWQAIMHIAPQTANMPAPNLSSQHVGQELVTAMINHIYQLASVVSEVETITSKQPRSLEHDFVATSLPLPLVVLDKHQDIIFANSAMARYLNQAPNDITGQNLYDMLDMSFPNSDTLDAWLVQAKTHKVVDQRLWDRVRLTRTNNTKETKLFDLAAYYNQGNPDGFEVMLVLFDHTEQYERDDNNLSFIALAVHELRTPVTLLRGYIEALEEELAGKLDPELDSFMHKMKASAQQLTTFINNILNVARVENDQLTIKLSKENWPGLIKTAINDLQLRADVQKVTISTTIADNLPSVGVDNVSIYEVLNNLIDNAIKYSTPGSKIIIKSNLNSEGLVETTVQDFGIGMPPNVVSNLFEKFYRSHRSKSQIGGTGLGLYLCKALIEAHGGNIWVRSREGQGSTFGFTIKPFASVDSEQKNSDNTDIIRRAHGWIKNHSLYRG